MGLLVGTYWNSCVEVCERAAGPQWTVPALGKGDLLVGGSCHLPHPVVKRPKLDPLILNNHLKIRSMPRDEQTLAEPPPHSGEILHSRRIKLYSATIVNAITLSVLFGVTAACPNECNGRGFCNPQRSQECICDAGFTGVDCSLRVCPAGAAWIDYAHAKVRRCNIKAKY